MKDFFSILNHVLQAYIVLCTSLLFKEKMDDLQVSRFVLRQIFCCPGLRGWPERFGRAQNEPTFDRQNTIFRASKTLDEIASGRLKPNIWDH